VITNAGKVSKVRYHVHSSSLSRLTATGTPMLYVITQCNLPPGRGDIPAVTPAKLILDLATPEGYKVVLTQSTSRCAVAMRPVTKLLWTPVDETRAVSEVKCTRTTTENSSHRRHNIDATHRTTHTTTDSDHCHCHVTASLENPNEQTKWIERSRKPDARH